VRLPAALQASWRIQAFAPYQVLLCYCSLGAGTPLQRLTFLPPVVHSLFFPCLLPNSRQAVLCPLAWRSRIMSLSTRTKASTSWRSSSREILRLLRISRIYAGIAFRKKKVLACGIVISSPYPTASWLFSDATKYCFKANTLSEHQNEVAFLGRNSN
jgi:hypothetical protein